MKEDIQKSNMFGFKTMFKMIYFCFHVFDLINTEKKVSFSFFS